MMIVHLVWWQSHTANVHCTVYCGDTTETANTRREKKSASSLGWRSETQSEKEENTISKRKLQQQMAASFYFLCGMRNAFVSENWEQEKTRTHTAPPVVQMHSMVMESEESFNWGEYERTWTWCASFAYMFFSIDVPRQDPSVVFGMRYVCGNNFFNVAFTLRAFSSRLCSSSFIRCRIRCCWLFVVFFLLAWLMARTAPRVTCNH